MWYKIIDIRKEKKTKKWGKIIAITGGIIAALAALAFLYKKFNRCGCSCCEEELGCDECDACIEESEEIKEEIEEETAEATEEVKEAVEEATEDFAEAVTDKEE